MTDLLILWLLLFLWCWDYPADHFLRRLIRLPGGPLVYFGLWHSWAMFAPHPVHLNRRLVALVTLSDGTRQQWQPLSSEGQSLLLRMLYVRSFKFEFSRSVQAVKDCMGRSVSLWRSRQLLPGRSCSPSS